MKERWRNRVSRPIFCGFIGDRAELPTDITIEISDLYIGTCNYTSEIIDKSGNGNGIVNRSKLFLGTSYRHNNKIRMCRQFCVNAYTYMNHTTNKNLTMENKFTVSFWCRINRFVGGETNNTVGSVVLGIYGSAGFMYGNFYFSNIYMISIHNGLDYVKYEIPHKKEIKEEIQHVILEFTKSPGRCKIYHGDKCVFNISMSFYMPDRYFIINGSNQNDGDFLLGDVYVYQRHLSQLEKLSIRHKLFI